MNIPAMHTFQPGDAIDFPGASGKTRAARVAKLGGAAVSAIETEDGAHKVVCHERVLVIAEKELRALLASAVAGGLQPA